MTHRFGLTNIFQMDVTLCSKVSGDGKSGCVHIFGPKTTAKSHSLLKLGSLRWGPYVKRCVLCIK